MAAFKDTSRATPSNIAAILENDGLNDHDELHDVFYDYFDTNSTDEEDEDEGETPKQTESSHDSEEEEEEVETFSVIQAPVKLTELGLEDEEDVFVGTAGKPDKKALQEVSCSCKYFREGPCYEQFDKEELLKVRLSHLEMTKDELDLVVLSLIAAGIQCGESTESTKRKNQKRRERLRIRYRHEGHTICRDIFMYLHGIGKNRLAALTQHYLDYGVTARSHGNSAKIPGHTATYEEKEKVVRFINNYAEVHGILLPGEVPGSHQEDLKLLPASCTKVAVYKCYAEACASDGSGCVTQRTFLALWKQYLPNVLPPMKPATDLCWQCRHNNSLILRANNATDVKKQVALTQAQQHLQAACGERAEYRRVLQEAEDAVRAQRIKSLESPGQSTPDCSRDMLCHYSFDFAQQVHYPSNPQQLGHICLKTPRKCGVFGVMTEALPQMVLFLLDEAVGAGKDANTVISLLDFFFTDYGLKETLCHLHADSRGGKGKKSAVLQYLLWRVMTGRHRAITLSFMSAGHSRFAPDWCFGLFKKRFRKTKVDCLNDISAVAAASSTSGIIVPVLCGDESGNVVVPVRNWSSHLAQWFQKLKGAKEFQHFEFKANGEVHVRHTHDSARQIVNLKKDTSAIPNSDLPPLVQSAGLSEERRMYLFQEIRQFVAEHLRDLVCPMPPGAMMALQTGTEPVAGPSGEQVGPSGMRARSSRMRSGSSRGRGESSRVLAESSRVHVESSEVQTGPSGVQAGPSGEQAGPSGMRARSSRMRSGSSRGRGESSRVLEESSRMLEESSRVLEESSGVHAESSEVQAGPSGVQTIEWEEFLREVAESPRPFELQAGPSGKQTDAPGVAIKRKPGRPRKKYRGRAAWKNKFPLRILADVAETLRMQAEPSQEGSSESQAEPSQKGPSEIQAWSSQEVPSEIQAQSSQEGSSELQARSSQEVPSGMQAELSGSSGLEAGFLELQAGSSLEEPSGLQAESSQEESSGLQAGSSLEESSGLLAGSSLEESSGLQAGPSGMQTDSPAAVGKRRPGRPRKKFRGLGAWRNRVP